MKVTKINAVVVGNGKTALQSSKEDYLILPTTAVSRKITAPFEHAVGKFVLDRLFEIEGGDVLTVKWGTVFKIEDEPEPGKED